MLRENIFLKVLSIDAIVEKWMPSKKNQFQEHILLDIYFLLNLRLVKSDFNGNISFLSVNLFRE